MLAIERVPHYLRDRISEDAKSCLCHTPANFPSILLSGNTEEMEQTDEMVHMKYHFQTEDFKSITQNYSFQLEKEEIYDEVFFDYDDSSLMKKSIWLKKVVHRNPSETHFSLKLTTPHEESIFYLETKWCLKDNEALKLFEAEFRRQYSFTVQRFTYKLPNTDVRLTKENIVFHNYQGSSFTMHAISGYVKKSQIAHTNTSLIVSDVTPCRSKIIELLFRCDRELFLSLYAMEIVPLMPQLEKVLSEREYPESLKQTMRALVHEVYNRKVDQYCQIVNVRNFTDENVVEFVLIKVDKDNKRRGIALTMEMENNLVVVYVCNSDEPHLTKDFAQLSKDECNELGQYLVDSMK